MYTTSISQSGFLPTPQLSDTAEDVSLGKFERLLKDAGNATRGAHTSSESPSNQQSMREAAKQMEIHMITMMFKTMEKSSTENGILGDGKSAGMSHFKDMFFENVAQELVKNQGLGFAEMLLNTQETKHLAQ